MAEAPQILRLDGRDHDLSQASDEARALVTQLRQLDGLLAEKTNLLALLHRAKNGYIADLKAEMIRTRTGVDLTTLFDQE